jgi:hypothetical protein
MSETSPKDTREADIQLNPLAIFHYPDRPIKEEDLSRLLIKPSELNAILKLKQHPSSGIDVGIANRVLTPPPASPPLNYPPLFEQWIEYLEPEFNEVQMNQRVQYMEYISSFNAYPMDNIRLLNEASLAGEWRWEQLENGSNILVPGKLQAIEGGVFGLSSFEIQDLARQKTYFIACMYYDPV